MRGRDRHRRVAPRGGQHLGRPLDRPAALADRRAGSRPASAPCCGRTRRRARARPAARPARATRRRSSRVRIVVAPSRCLQNDAKSCSPSSASAAAFISRLVERPRPGQHVAAAQRVHELGPVGHPVGVAPPRRREPGVEAVRRLDRPVHPQVGAQRRRSAAGPAARARRAARSRSACTTWPARVHAGVGAPGAGQPDLRAAAAPSPAPPTSSPSTVRSPGWAAQPWKSVPS